jgi:ligand-binding sensor domain-containing protein/signal transduction histidine kinase
MNIFFWRQIGMNRAAALAVLLMTWVPVIAWPTETTTPLHPAASDMMDAPVEPEMVRLPVIEGRDIRFARLSRSQGLSQQRVTSIVQDKQGFLWFGTHFGLNRYDGYHFRQFSHNPSDPSSLFNVIVTALFADRAGTLWVGCDYELDRYDPVTESFVHYRLPQPSALGGQIHSINQDSAGILWLSTGTGLFRLDPTNGEIKRFAHIPSNSSSLSSTEVKFSGEDRAGSFWVATSEGIDAFDRVHGRVTHHIPLREARDFSFYEDRTGTFWVLYASGNGLAQLDRDTMRLTKVSFGREDLPSRPLTGVSSMVEDQAGTLWIGTFSDGLLKFDRQHRRFIRYRNDPTDPASLTENRITTLLQDREKDIWVAFGATEPAHFLTTPEPFQILPFEAQNPDNLGEALVNGIYEDPEGTIWLGTTGALVRFDRKVGSVTHIVVPGHDIACDVLSTIEDSEGNLWIGTSGQGLYRRSRDGNHLTAFRHDDNNPRSLSDNTVTRLLIDHAGTLWVGTHDGLDRFDPSTQSITTYRIPGLDRGGENNRVADLAENRAGLLLVGMIVAGAYWFDPETETFSQLHLPSPYRTPVIRINSVLIDHTGESWLASQHGVDHFDSQSRWLARYTEQDGLPRNSVGCVLEDAAGGIWMGTGAGLSYLDPHHQGFTNYTQADGLPGLDFTGWRACFGGQNGELFLGGFSGAVAFHPETVTGASSYVPPVALTAFELFGKTVSIGANSVLKQAIGHTDQLTLAHNQNSLAFEFAALSFANSPSNRYRYKLEGFDQDWKVVGSDRRRADYTSLAPGKYIFRVEGATLRGPWGNQGASVTIRILQPWWNTWWFETSGVLVLIILSLGLYRLRLRQTSERLMMRMEERLAERTRIAQDLHDTVLQGLLSVSMQMDVANTKLSDADPAKQDFTSILSTLRQVAEESRNAVRGLRRLTLRPETLEDSIARIPQDLAADQQTAFTLRTEGESRIVKPYIQEELYLICREAIANAFRHAKATEIGVMIQYSPSRLGISIRDNGIGIGEDVVVEGRPGHFGLQGMHERAARIKAKLELMRGPTAGTAMEVTLPAVVAFESAAPARISALLARFHRRTTG